jgi:hypothetical protein
MRRVPLQRPENGLRDRWRHREMSSLGLEPVLVSHVLDRNRGAVWGGVLEGALRFLCRFGAVGVLQRALFLSGNTVFGFVTARDINHDADTDKATRQLPPLVGPVEVHILRLSEDGDGLARLHLLVGPSLGQHAADDSRQDDLVREERLLVGRQAFLG